MKSNEVDKPFFAQKSIAKGLSLSLLPFLLTACLQNKNVKGAYPTAPTGYTQGAAIGSVTGAAVAGFNNGTNPLGMAVGALLGAPVGSHNDIEGAIKQLATQGITVIRLGDIVEVVIPHDIVFDPENYDLKLSAQPILDQIVSILVQYPDVNISVIGHSDNLELETEQQSRSELQAEAIMAYIWSHGIPANRLNFYGVGATDTDASLKYANGQSYNRRVIIAFWRKGSPGPINGLLGQDPDCWAKADPDKCSESYFNTHSN